MTDTDAGTTSIWRRRWGIAVPASVLVSFAVVLVVAARDSTRVATRAEQARVEFGWPSGWLVQDQTALHPPLPTTATFQSPWEDPVSLELLPMLASVAVVTAVLLAGWLGVSALRARR